MRRLLLTFLLCSTWMVGQSKISDNQIRTPPPLQCSDTTTSGTTQTCTTAPSFTPAAKDCVTYNTTTTNTGALTLNVNSQGAKPVQKWLGTALVAGDVVANKPQLACYDGTNWQLSTIGNAPGTGSGTVTSVTCNAGLTGGAITTSGTCALATSGTSAAGMILLEEHTASTSAELDFTTCISSTYDDYFISIVHLVSASNAVSLNLQASTNGGSSYDSGSNYSWVSFAMVNNATGAGGSESATVITLGNTDISTTTSYGIAGNFMLYNPGGSLFKFLTGQTVNFSSNNSKLENASFAGTYKSTTAVNAFRVLFSSGNITSGTVRCYGLTK